MATTINGQTPNAAQRASALAALGAAASDPVLFSTASARAVTKNPIRQDVMASPPTVGPTTAGTPSGNSKVLSVTAANAPFTFYGTPTTTGASAGAVLPAYGLLSVEFMTDDPKPAIRTNANSNASQTLSIMVDDQYVSLTPYAPGISQASGYTPIDFGGVRKMRKFRITVIGYPGFFGISVGPKSTVLPTRRPTERLVVVGDSYTGGAGADRPDGGWAAVLGLLNGWEVCWDYGSAGGGGYVTPTLTGSLTALQRLPGVTAQNPKAVLIALGINDRTVTPSDITTAALAYYQALRAALPYARIVVMGAWAGSYTAAGLAAAENAIKAAFDAWDDANSRWIPVSTASPAAVDGNGYLNSQTSVGNSDLLIGGTTGSDPIHPTPYGHSILGEWASPRVREALA